MQKDTGHLLTQDEIDQLIEKEGKKPDDFIKTEVSVGMHVKVGNIICKVRKITKKDFILRPLI